jgi:hypothetical protein
MAAINAEPENNNRITKLLDIGKQCDYTLAGGEVKG